MAGLSYQQRKEQGLRKRLEYKKRLTHAEYIAVMFRGFGVGFSFIVVMTAIAGVHGLLDFYLFLLFILIASSGFIGAEMFLLRAEQSRYPKSRRRTLRSEVVDDWRKFRLSRKKS
jgi:hypothetical protein